MRLRLALAGLLLTGSACAAATPLPGPGAAIGTAEAAAPAADACALAHAPRQDFAMRIPFELIDGRIYVQARVNGRGPYKFALDTGASGMARADASLVSALGLDLQEPTANSDGMNAAQADTVHIASLDVGGVSRKNLRAITRDYNGRMSPEAALSGMVAREFFDNGLLVIDYPKRTLSFSEKLSLSPSHQGAVQYQRPFRVPVSIGDLRTEGNLDTGANVAFVMPQALFEKVSATAPRPAGRGTLSNSRIDTQRAIVRGPLRIGEANWSEAEVRVVARYPELLVGAYALQAYTVLIDPRSRSVALCR